LTFLNERRIVEMARDMIAEYFDNGPPPAVVRPRRIIPMMRRLPSGLIPPQFRDDGAETEKKPPTPYELAQKLARAKQPDQQPGSLPKDSPEHEPEESASLEPRSEEHTSELQSRFDLVCRLLLDKKK